ncbi:MAG: transporter substrate-binding domain-containing protein [Pseudomonadales bacterium]|nr:transporter substrate-binding domain-containing protein [Pseudomonadales bacterium]
MRFFTFTLCLLFGLLIISSSYACDNGTALISGDPDYPPLTWRSGDKLIGANVKLAKLLFKEVGIKAIPDEGGPWKRVLLRARRGKVDLLLGVRKTVEREQYLTYIEPPITPSAQSVFMANHRTFKYEAWKDLSTKIGGVTLGASFGKEFDAYAEKQLKIEQARTMTQNLAKLDIGRIDYLLGPLVTTQLHAQLQGYDLKIINAPTPLVVIKEYLAIPKNSRCHQYVAHFSKFIQELTATDRYDELLEEYFIYWNDNEVK